MEVNIECWVGRIKISIFKSILKVSTDLEPLIAPSKFQSLVVLGRNEL